MMYRAIKFINDGMEVCYKHFDTIEEAFKYYLPSLDDQEADSWHIQVLWKVIETFANDTELPFQRFGYTTVLNPETQSKNELFIQRVESIYAKKPFDYYVRLNAF